MESTCEYRTLRRNFSVVVDSLACTVDPANFVQKLNEVNLVNRDVVNSASVVGVLTPAQRIRPVIVAVHSQISLCASTYHTFVDILQQFNTPLAGVLNKFYGKGFSLMYI